MLSRQLFLLCTVVQSVLFSTSLLHSEPAYIPFQSLSYQVDSRAQSRLMGESEGSLFKKTIHVPGARWLRLEFGDYELGNKSYVIITSSKDGGRQRLDARSIPHYHNRTPFFNGDSVTVELFAAPEDSNIFITILAVYYGENGETSDELDIPDNTGRLLGNAGNTLENICGTDDRVLTTDPAVGRFVFFDVSNNMIAKCTAWIASSGAYLSAGHCFQRADDGDPDLLEFNVPLSDLNRNTNFANPNDQYPVDQNTFIRHRNGQGDDWSVFNCNPNGNTGLLPVQGQNDFFRTAKASDTSPTNIRITGHGIDDADRNRTLQTSAGPYLDENGSGVVVDIEYQVDTWSGNSGSPVIINGTEISIGVHTHGGCDPLNGFGNFGTSFENNDLEAALQGFFGTDVIYVDAGHPISSGLQNGTVLKPFDTVVEGVNAVPPGGTLRMVAGSYNESITVNKKLTMVAPVGSVIIGQ